MGRRRARFGYRSLVVALGMALAATGPAAGSPAAGAAPPTIRGHVRVDQVGYATGEAKRAFLLAEAPAGGAQETASRSAGQYRPGSAKSPSRTGTARSRTARSRAARSSWRARPAGASAGAAAAGNATATRPTTSRTTIRSRRIGHIGRLTRGSAQVATAGAQGRRRRCLPRRRRSRRIRSLGVDTLSIDLSSASSPTSRAPAARPASSPPCARRLTDQPAVRQGEQKDG